jgi:hypothetical protein
MLGFFPSQSAAQRFDRDARLGLSNLPTSEKTFRRAASPIHTTARSAVTDSTKRRHLWPFFALGGAILGGGTIALIAVKNCDQGCRDDGALAFLPPYVAIGALLGAIVGALIGLGADSS